MNFNIEVKARTETAEKTRGMGLIPAVLYGQESKPVSVSVEKIALEKLYKEAGEASLIDLSVNGGKPTKVLIKDIQVDPVKSNIIHIDFMMINMNKEMHATLPVRFIGESQAVKGLGGTLIQALEEINIKCLPKDLISHIDLDISGLNTFEDVIRVSDLKLPAGITILDKMDTLVAKVMAPLTEDQLKAMEEAGPKSIEDVKVETGKKDKEAGEGEEGAVVEPAAKGKEDKPEKK